MPEINGKQWTREEVWRALKEGRVQEIWPGATFEDHTEFGRLQFADGSRVRISCPPPPPDEGTSA